MKIYITKHKHATESNQLVCVSRYPFKQDRDGFINYEYQPNEGRNIHGKALSTTLDRSEGALIDVRRTPAEGYTPVEFEGCAGGVRDVLAGVPQSIGFERWKVYAKVLKRQMAPLPVDF